MSQSVTQRPRGRLDARGAFVFGVTRAFAVDLPERLDIVQRHRRRTRQFAFAIEPRARRRGTRSHTTSSTHGPPTIQNRRGSATTGRQDRSAGWRCHSVYIAGANAIGVPGCPELAFSTASMEKVRIVLMQRRSRSSDMGCAILECPTTSRCPKGYSSAARQDATPERRYSSFGVGPRSGAISRAGAAC